MANKLNSFVLGIFLGILLFVAPVLAAGTGISITEIQTPFNFIDVGNLSTGGDQPRSEATSNYVLWANVQDSGGDADGTVGRNDLRFINVTFIMPYGINPANISVCNATTYIWGAINTTNGTLNATHVACTTGFFNLTSGGALNVTLNVTVNISALTSGTLYQTAADAGGTRRPALIYAIANATNNSTATLSGVISSATQHNATSFWVNPRPYGYAIGGTNSSLYITHWDQTDPYYVMMVPLMKYNASKGRPDPALGTFAEILYMNTSIMERPGYMRLLSYNLTFKIIYESGTDAAGTTFNITSPIVANATYANETLMPLLIQNNTMFMPDGNYTTLMGLPSQGGFTVWHNNTTTNGLVEFSLAEMTARFGITMSYNPASQQLLVNVTNNTSALAANNTEFSILFTLINGTSGSSSPVYVSNQILSGFNMDSPPPLGSNISVLNHLNITNALANYTLRDIRIRFMMPMNVTVNSTGTNDTTTYTLTNMSTANASYFNYSSGAWMGNWNGFMNSTSNVNMSDSIPGSPAKGANISIWFMYVDINVTNGSYTNWNPRSLGNASFNFTAYMTFPVMNESTIPANSPGTKNYTATVQMNMQGRLNLTDKVPGLNSSATGVTVKLDGQTLAANSGNYTIGSLTLDNVGSGMHTIEAGYTIPSEPGASGGGSESTGASGAGGAAGLIIPAGVTESKFTVSAGASIVVDFGAPAGGGESEKHTVKVDSILGTTVTLKITSDPVIVKASVGIPAFADVDGDGVNDLKILVNQMLKANSIEITITKLRAAAKAAVKQAVAPEAEVPAEEAPSEAPTEAVTEEVSEKPTAQPVSTTMILVVVVIIALVGLGYWFTQKKGQLTPTQRSLGWAIKYINDTLVKSTCYYKKPYNF